MTATELRAWAKRQGYSYERAAAALGISRSTYADMVSGTVRTTGIPKVIDKRTELACKWLEYNAGAEPQQVGLD